MVDKQASEGLGALHSKVQEALNLAQESVMREIEHHHAQQQQEAKGGLDAADLLNLVRQFNETSSQVGLLNLLVDSVGQYVPRAMLMIRKGAAVHGWAGRGFSVDFTSQQLKRVKWPIDKYPEITKVTQDGAPLQLSFSDLSEISEEISAIDGFVPLKSCFFPIQVKNKIAAILYCDTGSESKLENQDFVEVLTRVAGTELTLVTTKIKKASSKKAADPAPKSEPAAPAEPAVSIPPVAVAEPAPVPEPVAPAPVPEITDISNDLPQMEELPQEPSFDVSSSFESDSSLPSLETQAIEPQAIETQPAPNLAAPADEDDPNIKKARRVARVLVSDLKLYNETAVETGSRNGDLYKRLQDDIDRSYKHYQERVSALLSDHSANYFKEELVRQLAGGDASKLGPLPF